MTTDPTNRILVVDDEPVIVEALRRVLGAAGYVVKTAADAETGLDAMEGFRPGVVVIDLKLPGMSGLEFMPLAVDRDCDVVIVLMSGYSSTEHVVLSLQAGAFTFLAKPFTFEEARNAVARAVCFRSLGEADRAPRGVHGPGSALFGVQGWCRVDPGGIGLVGVTDVYMRTMGRPTAIHAPPVGYPLMQGDVLGRIEDADGNAFIAWSALGGRVLDINPSVMADPGLLLEDPYGRGWLAQMKASSPEDDLARLRSTGSDAIRGSLSGAPG